MLAIAKVIPGNKYTLGFGFAQPSVVERSGWHSLVLGNNQNPFNWDIVYRESPNIVSL